jgi:hypothetical protein
MDSETAIALLKTKLKELGWSVWLGAALGVGVAIGWRLLS